MFVAIQEKFSYLNSLYDTVQIPVRRELVSSTGSFELSIILNQIIFSTKELMTIDDISRLSLSELTKQTLRKKLNKLVSLGLISKWRPGSGFKYLYSAANDTYTESSEILALIEGLDLKSQPCYLTAAILNKFRQFALSDVQDIHISAFELKQIVGTEKSASLVRLILRRLVEQNYLSETLIKGSYCYKINRNKFLNVFDPALLELETNSLLKLYINYLSLFNVSLSNQRKSAIKLSFKRLLNSGYSANSILHIISYFGVDRNKLQDILTPAMIRSKFDELYRKSSAGLSKRKGLRFIYKLNNGLISLRPSPTIPMIAPVSPVIAVESDYWLKAKDFIDSKLKSLRNWFNVQSAGVRDVDFDDYFNQAIIFAYERFSKGIDDDNNSSGLKFRLQDYMYRRRHNDKSVKRGDNDGVNNIVTYFDGDISEIIDRIDVICEEAADVEHNTATDAVAKLLQSLDPRSANIVADYHGLDGISYTFEEIAVRCSCSPGYVNRLYHAAIKLLREKPPD